MSKKARIQVVDDEKNIAEALRYNLEREGYEVQVCEDGMQALVHAREQRPDLILLDWMLPEMDGLEVCKRLSADPRTQHIPILLLTVKNEETDKVLGLEMGAVDFITKPFSVREVLARVKANLRLRSPAPPPAAEVEVFVLGPLRVDWARHRAQLSEQSLELTSKEFQLLKALVEARGRVLSREQLLSQAWDYQQASDISTRTVDLHVSQLRRKLGSLAGRLVTVKNAGYRLDQEP